MNTRSFAAALLALGLFTTPLWSQHPAAPSHSTSPSAGLYVSPILGLKGAALAAALSEPFPDAFDVTLDGAPATAKQTLKTCLDVLALGTRKYTTGLTPDDNTLHATAVRCYALDWLRTAKAPAQPSFQNFSFRQLQARSLPPELALAISDQETAQIKTLSAQGKSILALEPDAKLRTLTPERAKLLTEDWTATLTVYAHGDFLGDGTDQLLLRWDASATGGSYTDTRLFLLARQGTMLKVVRQY